MGIGPCVSRLEGVHSGLKVIRDQKHRLFVLQAHQHTAAGSLQRKHPKVPQKWVIRYLDTCLPSNGLYTASATNIVYSKYY